MRSRLKNKALRGPHSASRGRGEQEIFDMSTETKEMLGEHLMLDEWAENLRYGLRPSQSEGHRLSDVMVAMSVLCTELQDEISERGGDGRQVVISRTQFGAGYWLTAEWYREKAKALEPLCGAGLVV